MALDPSIALGIKPVEVANPLNQFAQVAQLQHYQQQNALAQRAMDQEDALNRAYSSSIGTAGEIDPNKLRQSIIGANLGSKLPAVEKTLMEGRELKAKVGKSELELGIAKANQAIRELTQYNTLADVNAHIDQNLAAGKITPEQAAQTKAQLPASDADMPKWQVSMLRKTLDTKDLLEQHFTAQDYGGGTRVIATPKYGGGPAQVVQGSQVAKTATPGELLVDARAKERADLKPVPVHAQKAITGAAATLGQLDKAIAELEANPDAVGWKGYAPDAVLNRADPAGTQARASLADIGSLKIHERSGAAVTASETPRLKPFIPSISDDYDTALTKLKRMRDVLTGTYNRDQGFRDFTAPQPTPAAPAKPAAQEKPAASEKPAIPAIPKVGTIQDGYRFKGGNPADPKNWEKK
jgi:hypothetical protein